MYTVSDGNEGDRIWDVLLPIMFSFRCGNLATGCGSLMGV